MRVGREGLSCGAGLRVIREGLNIINIIKKQDESVFSWLILFLFGSAIDSFQPSSLMIFLRKYFLQRRLYE